MLVVRAPTLHRADITDLRPTQISVGMREVEDKRHRWREKDAGMPVGVVTLNEIWPILMLV